MENKFKDYIIIVQNDGLSGEAFLVNGAKNIVYHNLNKIEGLSSTAIIEQILNLATSWKKEYINSSIIDGISMRVIIEHDGKSVVYRFRNSTPSNFSEFAMVLDEIRLNDRK